MSVVLRLAPLVSGLFALSACGGMRAFNLDTDGGPVGGDADVDADADADADVDADGDADVDIQVNSVDPTWGSNGGGSTVEIWGGPFDDSAQVFFVGDANEEADIESVESDHLTVSVPASSDVGFVDIEVSTDTGAGSASSVFEYWEDATGLSGLLGELSWVDYVGTYWASPAPVDTGYASAFFIDPAALSFWDLLMTDQFGACRSNYAGSSDVMPLSLGADELEVLAASSSTPLTLAQDVYYDWYYAIGSLSSSQLKQNATYALNTVDAPGFPSIAISDFATTPGSLSVTAPNIAGSSPPKLSKQNLNFTWSPNNPGDYMVLTLDRWSSTGTLLETVSCAMADNGSFKVPSSLWAGWQSNQQISIALGRVTESSGTLPHNNASSGEVGIYWVIGAGLAQ